MFPLIAPLLSLGVSLVEELFDKEQEKKANMECLQRLADAGDHDQLDAEVTHLKKKRSARLKQPSVPVEPLELKQAICLSKTSDKAQVKLTGKWRDYLGMVCVASIGLNYIGVYFVNTLINITNTFITPLSITASPALNIEDVITILIGMLGLGGLDLVHKRIKPL